MAYKKLLECPELYTCQVGVLVRMPREWHMKKVLQEINKTLGTMSIQECPDLWAQLFRWKNQIARLVDDVKPGTDPNGVVFPLPAPILEDPLVLRPWGPYFNWNNSYTDYISRTPAWPPNDGTDTHDYFAKLVASSRHTGGFSTNLDGRSAWCEIQPNLMDVPTDEQERIWRVRAKRTDLNDEQKMREQRRKIADSLTRRHEWPPAKVEPFLAFADNLKAGWEAFLALCRKDWIPPRGPFNRRKPPKSVDLNVLKKATVQPNTPSVASAPMSAQQTETGEAAVDVGVLKKASQRLA